MWLPAKQCVVDEAEDPVTTVWVVATKAEASCSVCVSVLLSPKEKLLLLRQENGKGRGRVLLVAPSKRKWPLEAETRDDGLEADARGGGLHD